MSNRGSLRKERMEQQKRFQNALVRLFPDWDPRHFIAAIAEVADRGTDMDALAEKGEALLQEYGKGLRGRKPRAMVS